MVQQEGGLGWVGLGGSLEDVVKNQKAAVLQASGSAGCCGMAAGQPAALSGSLPQAKLH